MSDVLTSCDENEFLEKAVCDLGCSAGILGIIALVNGAKKVVFQDYVSILFVFKESFNSLIQIFQNEDVLETFTIPNVILSIEERGIPEDFSKCEFYSGDWESFNWLTANQEKFDVILTSETIYSPENYRKLIDFFKSRLASGGKVFLSAKSYYFGVSGNILDFCKLMDEETIFSYESLWKSVDGVQREILLIKLNEL